MSGKEWNDARKEESKPLHTQKFFLSILTVKDNCVNNSWCSNGFFENNSKFDEFTLNFLTCISEFVLPNQKPHSENYLLQVSFYMAQRPCDSVTQQKSEPIYRPILESALA